MGGRIRTEREGAVGWIVFDHPERRNAISAEMWRAIPEAARELASDDAIRVVGLRGAGEVAFVSGADISEFERLRSGARAADYDRLNRRAIEALLAIPKPVLAAIHGYCVGGGVVIALSADLRYAAEDAVFAIPAARLGLGYSPGGVELLARVVGPAYTKEILFTARRFDAREALAMGLANAVVPKRKLDEHVRAVAERIAENAPLTLRAVKRVLAELARDPGERDLEAMHAAVRACYESEDYAEGVRAFLEKRRPRFRGR